MPRVIDEMIARHDLRLVLVAALICLLASFTAAALLSRARASTGRQRLLWIAVASVEFGSGVWSLHFVAMLAFMPGMPVRYSVAPTAWSAAFAVLGSFPGFLLAVSDRRGPARVLGAAAMLTLAIGAMHYTGVSAMRPGDMFRLDPAIVAGSVGSAAAFCVVAVLSMRRLDGVRRQAVTTVLLSTAICALHFLGMAAMTLRPDAMAPAGATGNAGTGGLATGVPLGSGALAVVVATSSIALVLLSLTLSIVDRLLCDRAGEERTRLRKLTAVSFEGLIIEQAGVIVDANERVCEFTGFAPADIIGRPVDFLLTPAGGPDAGEAPGAPQDGDHDLRRASGTALPVELLARPITAAGRCGAVAIAIRDLTARRESEAALQHLAHHDGLTGLANRVLLDRRMRQVFENPQRADRPGAVLYLDLDRFKPVNDLLGHAAGDALLVAVALRLGALTRQSDTLARVGGDEFVILMPDAPEIASCRSLATRILHSLREPFPLGDQQVVVGASIGIALYPRDGRTGEELLRCADIAMYRSKREGRGAYCLFEPRMDVDLRHQGSLERDLREAVEAGALALHYQPIVDCAGGSIDGYEALLRWRHPTRGQVAPGEFIPIAEETGLILPIGQWVLETACAAASAWEVPRRIAVNLSPIQFRERDLIERIADTLRRTGLAPGRLEIEVTEGVLIDEPARAITLLRGLRDLGVRVSLDDFGTGYSSLSYLREFPLDRIKIDRSFIAGLGADDRSAPIVSAVIALAHSLDLQVTAEGIETERQLELLRDRSCDQVQGYLLGRPAPLPPSGGGAARRPPAPSRRGMAALREPA